MKRILCVLVLTLAGCNSVKSKHIELNTTIPDVFAENPVQTVSVKVVYQL